jgi:hypothetical protein
MQTGGKGEGGPMHADRGANERGGANREGGSAGRYERERVRAQAAPLPYRMTSRNARRMSIDVPAAFVRFLEWQESMNPRVRAVPWVSYHTAQMTGRGGSYPPTGTGSAGLGRVWENPTHGLPVSNPRHFLDKSARNL